MTFFAKAWQWVRTGERQIWFEYGLLTLVILLPLLGGGYILTLDLVFTPHFAWPQEVSNTYPLQAMLWLLYQVFPGDIVEKLVLVSVLLFAGAGMHLLVRYCGRRTFRPETWTAAAYFAGLLYMVNPFVYARFMAGQWMVLLGYALLPFFVRALLRLLYEPSWRHGAGLAAWAFVITTVSLHHAGMLALLGAVVLLTGCVRYRRDALRLRKLLLGGVMAAVLWFAASSFWLVPTLAGHTTVAESVHSFNHMHFTAFATLGSNTLGAVGNVIRLQGFWTEAQQLFVLPQQVVPAWGIFVLFLWLIVGAGAAFAWRKNRTVAVLGLCCIGLGVTLAATPILEWIARVVPFVRGYREPHKFVTLVALGYALLGAYGVAFICDKWKSRERLRTALLVVAFILPIAITPVMFGGFAGQLTPRQYPKEWQAADVFVRQRIGNERALFLPWHQYASYSFSGRTIANPAANYFSFPVIMSDDPEFKNVPPTTPNEETRRIYERLHDPTALARYLSERGVRFVLLAKEQEYHEYAFLDDKPYIPVFDSKTIKVYEVRP